MTDLPAWVMAGENALASGAFVDVLVRDQDAPLYRFDPALVYTSTSKGPVEPLGPLNSPWFRYPDHRSRSCCSKCPQPMVPSDVFGYTKRCRECNTRSRQYQRAKSKLGRLLTASAFLSQGLKWVTLTMPNFESPDEGLTRMKKIFKNFRQRKKYTAKISGSADFWEWTENPVDGSFNVHYHGLWVGDYWEQSDLLEEWGVGGARINAAGSYRKRLNYLIHYAKKQEKLGIRCQQLTGCLYGSAFAEIESAAKHLLESSAVEPAPDSEYQPVMLPYERALALNESCSRFIRPNTRCYCAECDSDG